MDGWMDEKDQKEEAARTTRLVNVSVCELLPIYHHGSWIMDDAYSFGHASDYYIIQKRKKQNHKN